MMYLNSLMRGITALLLGGVISAASAAEKLFDFSSSECGWKCGRKEDSLKLSTEFPVDGEKGLLFSGPAWKGGKETWPSCETRSPRYKDWRKFDRLVVTVFNDSDAQMKFTIFISDSKTPFRQGLVFPHRCQPYRAEQLIVPLKNFAAKKINPADISIIHVCTENPPSKVRFFIDGFTLLESGEAVPELPKSYLQKIHSRRAAVAAPQLNRIESEAARFDYRGLPPEMGRSLREHVDARLARFRGGKADDLLIAMQLSAKTNTPPPPDWNSVRSLIPAVSGFEALRKAVAAAPGNEDVLLGYATPMDKVLPRAPIFRPLPNAIAIEAARNEKEAAQLIVLPFGRDRKQVGVKLSAFIGEAGTLPASALSAAPVGFVETTFVPISGSEYVGFWPDPLLSFLDTVDIKAGEAQMFWIKADIPEETPAGIYSGKAEVTIEGKTAFSVPVSIRVRNFALPKRSMLPLTVTFWPNDDRMPICNPNYDPIARKSPAAPVNAWKKHKKEWRDLLAGYYLMLDSLYEDPRHGWEPQLELLAELDKEGKLGLFNLGYCNPALENPNHGMQKAIDRIRPRYEKAKQLGILKHAYIYVGDEILPEEFPLVDGIAAILKKEFPEVPISTSSFDPSYGMDGQLKSIDRFSPLTPVYNEKQAAAARKAGKQVWWYICCIPHPPHANIFIESAGIGTRLLMGAMSAKYRPDGFAYYQTSLWSCTSPITSGPYTDWIAQSWPNYNGDGNWTYPGPDSTPLGSIRLENFRDGLEDYAYVKILEQRLAAAKQNGKDPQWQRKAEAALKIPVSLVETLTKYTKDPQKVYAWRSRLADLIEAAPVSK